MERDSSFWYCLRDTFVSKQNSQHWHNTFLTANACRNRNRCSSFHCFDERLTQTEQKETMKNKLLRAGVLVFIANHHQNIHQFVYEWAISYNNRLLHTSRQADQHTHTHTLRINVQKLVTVEMGWMAWRARRRRRGNRRTHSQSHLHRRVLLTLFFFLCISLVVWIIRWICRRILTMTNLGSHNGKYETRRHENQSLPLTHTRLHVPIETIVCSLYSMRRRWRIPSYTPSIRS